MGMFFRIIRKILFRIFLLFFIISILSVIFFRFVPVPITPLMVTRLFEQNQKGTELRLKKDWVADTKISNNLKLAVICSEDQNFYNHFGFDFDAMKKAYEKNKKGKKKYGASTITQQTAKNLFLWQGRSYVRKILEAYFTVLLEIFWSKERILTVYLNIIEMGNGIYGAEAAANFYFNKNAEKLSKKEAASIAAILPAPLRWNPAKPNGYIQWKTNRIVNRMNKAGSINGLKR